MQLVNPLIDNDLGGSWKGGYPTPTREDFAVLEELRHLFRVLVRG